MPFSKKTFALKPNSFSAFDVSRHLLGYPRLDNISVCFCFHILSRIGIKNNTNRKRDGYL